VRVNQWATGYLTNNDPRIHFGLGQEKQIDLLEIKWSDGKKETYKNIASDRYITIMEGSGIVKE
jgi:hypothetical protein